MVPSVLVQDPHHSGSHPQENMGTLAESRQRGVTHLDTVGTRQEASMVYSRTTPAPGEPLPLAQD